MEGHLANAPMKRLVFQSYPNNEVRIGWDDLPYPKRKKQDTQSVRDAELRGVALEESISQFKRDNNVVQYRDSKGCLWRGTYDEMGEYSVAPFREGLVITSEVQESPKKNIASGRDYSRTVEPTRFTRNARHRLLEAGALCEDSSPRYSRNVFVTFTLPGSTPGAYSAISRYSGFITNRVLQGIRDDRRVESWFYVWERQKRGALHLHLCVRFKSQDDWLCLADVLYERWYSVLEDVGEREGICLFEHSDSGKCTARRYWRYDYQLVRKSVGGYLSKYVSKGVEEGTTPEPTKAVQSYYPRRWWGMSRNLTQEINRRRKTVCVEGVREDSIRAALNCFEEMAISCEPVLEHEYDAELGRSSRRDGSFGRTYRRLYWFPREQFADIELCLRTEFLSLIASMQKVRVTYRGFALDYGGEKLPIPGE